MFSIDRPYDYKIPDNLIDSAVPGVRVTVPFGRGNQRCEGIILSICSSEDTGLKAVESVLDSEPVLDKEQLQLALWMHERFFCTVYSAVQAMLPVGMWFKDGERRIGDKSVSVARLNIPAEDALIMAQQKRSRAHQQASILELLAQIGEASVKEICYFTGASRASIKALEKGGYIAIDEIEVYRKPDITPDEVQGPLVLNERQQEIFDGLKAMLGKSGAALLYGITGSGKTSVYIKLITEVISAGKSAIVLVPEIALTPQLMSTFAAYFGDNVAVLHSALSMGERYDEWKRIKNGDVNVVVGTRSAVFAPVKKLGVIILDEEQENTYKSENSPRYHARDVAKYRCVHSNALLLLGSATPSVDSMFRACGEKYKLFRLDSRYNNKPLPPVIIADIRREIKSGNFRTISSVLENELKKNIQSGEQSILFLNRRGASTFVACGECGYTFTCPKCSVSMTYHSANRRMMCHYCGHSEPMHNECPECGGKLKYDGAGTQKVEAELKEIFPDTEIIRMDTDTVSPSNPHEKLLAKFRNRRIPILLGTQMVTKGLDFENVTLVGVLSADQMLYVNDYRARERTFSLITQVVGRSGRGEKEGRAVIQTFTPENEVIRLASKQDYDSFYAGEIELRRLQRTPPIYDLYTLTASGLDEISVIRACMKLKSAIEHYLEDIDTNILGPAPASITKINNRYRYRVSLICTGSKRIRDTFSHIIRQFSKDREFRGISVYADIDPIE